MDPLGHSAEQSKPPLSACTLLLRAAALPVTLLGAWAFFPFCQTGPTLCIWTLLLNIHCLGCGLTRAICFLVHGHIRDALAYNPGAPFVLFVIAGISLDAVQQLIRLERRTIREESSDG